MKRKYRHFFDVIDGQENWLNLQCDKGLRLICADEFSYDFRPCAPSEYEYRVVAVSYALPEKALQIQIALEELHLHVVQKSMKNLGLILLIAERKADGTPFEVNLDLEDGIRYYRKTRSIFMTADILLCMLLFLEIAIGTAFAGRNLVHILLGLLIFFLSIESIKYTEIVRSSVLRRSLSEHIL